MSGWNESGREPFDRVAAQVRQRYTTTWTSGTLLPLGNGGGFSGARLWRCQGVAGTLCLRAWPATRSATWVGSLHQLMESARRQGLGFIPAVYTTREGDTVVEAAGRAWELTQWLEGRADFADNPSPARLEAACESVARLHRAWEALAAPPQPCPAVHFRRKVLADWQTLVASGWRPQVASTPFDVVWPVAERAWRGLPCWLSEVSRCLDPWIAYRASVQPCLRDVWHDHLLFDGDRLTGLVDYGAVKGDHVAADLARLLGSLVSDDPEGWECGLRAYRRVCGLNDIEAQLARALDRTGTILALANWLRWLYYEGRRYEDLSAIVRRLESLLNRIESWRI